MYRSRVLPLMTAVFCSFCIAQADWSTQGGNMYRNGRGQGIGPVVGCAKWIYHTKDLPEFPYMEEADGGGIYSGIALGYNGNVHFGCEDGYLYTLDKDGNFLWKYDVSVIDPVIEGHWMMDETSGPVINDDSGDRDATLHYDPNNTEFSPFYEDPQEGNVIAFDGQDVYIQVDDYKGVLGTAGRLCSMKIKTTQETGGIMYWGESVSVSAGLWRIVLSGGKVFVLCGQGFNVIGSTAVNDGAWHKIEVVLPANHDNFNNVKIYVDDEDDTGLINIGESEFCTEYGLDVMIGCEPDGSNKFTGYMKDVKICSLGWASEPMSSIATDAAGNVYVGSENGLLYSIDKDGNKNWTCETEYFIYSTPVIDLSGRIFFGSSDGLLYAVDSEGQDLWSFEVPGPGVVGNPVLASPTIGKDGAVYTGGTYTGIIYSLDPVDGSINWTCDLEEPDDPVGSGLIVSPVVAEDGTIYAAMQNDPKLYAIDPNDGQVIWSTNLAYDPDLIAYWKFNEDYSCTNALTFNAGLAIDSSLNENYLMRFNEISYLTFSKGRHGTALKVYENILTNYIRTPSPFLERTITGWFNYDPAYNSNPVYIWWKGGETGYIKLSPEEGSDDNVTYQLSLEINGGYLKTDYIIKPQTWYHFAISIEDDGPDTNMDDAKIYIDGILIADNISNSGFQLADTPLGIDEEDIFDFKAFLMTHLDDLRIYKKALSVEKIRELMYDETAPLWTEPGMDEDNEDFKFLWTQPVIGLDGTIYTGYEDNYIRAVDPADGNIKWVKRLGESSGYDLSVDSEGKIYAAGYDGELYVISPEGEFLSLLDTEKVTRRHNDNGYHFHLGNSHVSFPVIGSDGTVYLSDAGNRVWAVSCDGCEGKSLDLTYQAFDRSNLNDQDSRIDLVDVAEFISQWRYCNTTSSPCGTLGGEKDPIWQRIFPDDSLWHSADLNMDKYVDFADLAQLLELWLVEY